VIIEMESKEKKLSRGLGWLTVVRNVPLTFDFDFGLNHSVPEGYVCIYGDLALQVGGRVRIPPL
jgi:hypothetical protein